MIKLRRLKNEDNDYLLLEKWYKEKEVYENFEQRILSYEEIKNKYYPRTLNNTSIPVHIIEYNDIPVGIIQYKMINEDDKKLYRLLDDNIYEIDIFIGENKYKHKGIGSYVINEISRKIFNEKNANLLVMCPLKSNVNAINCYLKCGFEIIKYFNTKDTIGNNKEYVLMIKNRNSTSSSC